MIILPVRRARMPRTKGLFGGAPNVAGPSTRLTPEPHAPIVEFSLRRLHAWIVARCIRWVSGLCRPGIRRNYSGALLNASGSRAIVGTHYDATISFPFTLAGFGRCGFRNA